MVESEGNVEAMDFIDDTVKDESEIFLYIKSPETMRKISVCRTATVKQVSLMVKT